MPEEKDPLDAGAGAAPDPVQEAAPAAPPAPDDTAAAEPLIPPAAPIASGGVAPVPVAGTGLGVAGATSGSADQGASAPAAAPAAPPPPPPPAHSSVAPAAPPPAAPAHGAPGPGYGDPPLDQAYPRYDNSPPPPSGRSNTLAIVSLVAGICGWTILPFVGSITAIITGHIAKKQIRETGEQGSGMATAGLVLGYIGVVLAIIGTIVAIAVLGALRTMDTSAAAVVGLG